MKINPKECKFYAKGGYCCTRQRCLTDVYGQIYGRNRCNEIAFCCTRTKCHVKIGSDTKCIKFIKKKGGKK